MPQIPLYQELMSGVLGNDPAPEGGSKVPLPIKILLNFIELGLLSLVIGIVTGLVGSYMFKRMRFLTHSAIKETLLIFCFGYLAYSAGELAH